MEIVTGISNAIQNLQLGNTGRAEIYSNKNVTGSNEFLFFIKPEICMKSASIKLEEILTMMLTKINEQGLKIKNILALSAHYLKQYDIIAQHYGIINAIARDASASLTQQAKAKFETLFGIPFAGANVLGGIEFASRFPELSASAIDYLWQNAAVEKLGGGAYAGLVKIDGLPVYLVNGFHPRQLEHFVDEGRAIIAMTLCGNTSWADARNKLIGKTNPKDAADGSIRKTLLENKDEYGLPAVSSSWNGVHLSAGPLEGLIELIRYNSNFETGKIMTANDFMFGKSLSENYSKEQLEIIMSNPEIVYKGEKISLFDLTEEINSNEALKLLKDVELN